MRHGGHRRLIWLILGITAITYARLFTAEFTVWDDSHTVAHNPAFVPPDWQKIGGYWNPIADGTTLDPRIINHQYSLWIPLTYTVWGVLAGFAQVSTGFGGGRELNPYVFHAFNVVVHSANALMVFLVLRRLKVSDAAAAVGALVFAVHPVQVEAVAWVSGLKDLLAGGFSILAMYFYIAHTDETATHARARLRWWLALTAFAAAGLCKPSAVATPLILLVIDFLLLGRPWRQIFISLTPFFAAALPIALIAKLAQPATGITSIATADRLLVAADALGFYARQILWPAGLCIDYGRTPEAVITRGPIWWMWLLVGALVAATLFALRRGDRRPFAGICIFVAALLPVLGFSRFIFQFYSTTTDHYLYVAMLGVALIAAVVFSAMPARVAAAVATVLIAALSVRSIVQTGTWKDSRTLFENVVEVNPTSTAGLGNLGMMKRDSGDPAAAAELFRRALVTKQANLLVMRNLRSAYIESKDPTRAMDVFRREMVYIAVAPNELAVGFWHDPAAYAALLIYRGHIDAAKVELDRLMQLSPPKRGTAASLHDLIRLVEEG